MKPLKITENQKVELGKLVKQYYEGYYDQNECRTHIKQFDEYEHGYVWNFVGWYCGKPSDCDNETYAHNNEPVVYDCDGMLIPE